MLVRLSAVAVAALAGVSFAAGPPTRVYRDPDYGFVVRYPKRFRVEPFVNANPNQTFTGVAFGTVRDPAPYVRSEAKPPPRSVLVLVEHSAGGPPPLYPVFEQDTKLPLARSSFLPEGPTFWSCGLLGNGWYLGVVVRIGPRAAMADRDAVWTIVRSLRMRALRPGDVTGDAQYTVLRTAGTYPVGSVTRAGPVFLVHATHGFYSLGDAPCDLSFTLPVAFSCPDGRAWDRMGPPLWSGAGKQDALPFAPTALAGDGHVLVAESTETGGDADSLEQQLWG